MILNELFWFAQTFFTPRVLTEFISENCLVHNDTLINNATLFSDLQKCQLYK